MHCLNLKITYRCTNKCAFCFSSYLAGTEISTDRLISAVANGYDKGCRELVISGGEPTLLPDVVSNVIQAAEKCGYRKYIIQTNGSGLAENDALISFLRSLSERSDVCVSFSVHGHNADVHDAMCSTPGAFDKLMTAMRKTTKTNCGIYTNTVMSALNISHLKEIARMIMPFNPQVVQFSLMHLSSPSKLSTGIVEATMAVRGLKNVVSPDLLRTEGIPYCLMYRMEKCVGESFWPEKLDLYNKNDEYMPDVKQLDLGMRWKSAECSECLMNDICMGIWKEHVAEYVKAGIRPIA